MIFVYEVQIPLVIINVQYNYDNIYYHVRPKITLFQTMTTSWRHGSKNEQLSGHELLIR